MQARQYQTIEEIEAQIGDRIRQERLALGHTQEHLAGLANVSLTSLQKIEAGKGVTFKTFLAIIRALGKLDLLDGLHVAPDVSPMQMLRASKSSRQRAFSPRSRKGSHA